MRKRHSKLCSIQNRCGSQVGVHELLGHGSGKLFHAGAPDAEALVAGKVVHPLTNRPIEGPFYPPGATWDSIFGE